MPSLVRRATPIYRAHLPLLAILLWAPDSSVAQSGARWSTNYYDVTGTSVREIRQSMRRSRPARVKKDALTEWDIQTRYSVVPFQGRYRCAGFTATVTIKITLPRWTPPGGTAGESSLDSFSSPREERVGRGSRRGEIPQNEPPLPGPLLHSNGGEGEDIDSGFLNSTAVPPGGVSNSVKEEWDRYIAALMEHELGHAQFALSAAAELHRRIKELAPEPDQNALKSRVQTVVQETIEEFKGREREYDRLTEHGVTKGATLAPAKEK